MCALQIPLLQTLPGTSTGGRQLRWYSLLRRTGSQHITGDLQVGGCAPVLPQAPCCCSGCCHLLSHDTLSLCAACSLQPAPSYSSDSSPLFCWCLPFLAHFVQVGFSWSFTRETLLACELTELERLLAGRQEVLAMLHPLSSSKVARMMTQGSMAGTGLGGSGTSGADSGAEQLAAADPTQAALLLEAGSIEGALSAAQQQQQQEQISSESEDGFDSDGEAAAYLSPGAESPGSQPRSRRARQDSSSGSSRIIRSPDVFAGLNLGLADSNVVTLEVGVVEVTNLAPRSGWSQDLTHALLSSAAAGNARGADSSSASAVLMETAKRQDLPLPVVYVFCGAGGPGDKGFEVRGGRR